MKSVWGVLVVSASLHLALATIPDRMGDLLLYRQWTRELAAQGLIGSYWPSPAIDPYLRPAIDYPPVFPYALWLLGKSASRLVPSLMESDRALDFAIRVVISMADLLVAGLLYVGLRPRVGAREACLGAASFALSPAVLFDGAYWGQAGALCAVFVVAALVAERRGHAGISAAALSLACLAKPLAWPLAPLLLLAAWRRGGGKGVLKTIAVALATVAMALVPFLVRGRLVAFLQLLAWQVDAMPYASVNAHNLWWIATGGLPWTRADARLIGPLSYETVGLILFGAWYAVVVRRYLRDPDPGALATACASVALGLFVLATHMHENHLFLFLPLVLLAEGARPAIRPFFFAATAVMLANMALHDPLLSHVFAPLAPGPRVLLPQQPEVDAALLAGLAARGYAYVVEQIRGDSSLLWVALTLVNSALVVLLFAGWVARGAAAARERVTPKVAVGIALGVVASAAPLLVRATGMSRA